MTFQDGTKYEGTVPSLRIVLNVPKYIRFVTLYVLLLTFFMFKLSSQIEVDKTSRF